MNRKVEGYTFITTILVLTLVIIIAYYIYQDTNSFLHIYEKEEDSIQASYYAESIVNILLSDKNEDRLKENLNKLVSNRNNTIDFPLKENLDSNLESKSFLTNRIYDKDNPKLKAKDAFNLEVDVKYKGIKRKVLAKGLSINDIYKNEKGVINKHTVNNEYYNILKNKYDNLKSYWTKKDNIINLDDNDYTIAENGKNYSIYKLVEDKKEIVCTFYPEKYVYIFQDGGNLIIEDNMKINGILDVQNIILHKDLNFSGILNLKSNIITKDNVINIDGMLINLSDAREDNINVKYNSCNVHNLGKFLPDFIKPRIYSIKKV